MKSRFNGILITFEGTEGAGKSTLIRSLAGRLREFLDAASSDRQLTLTREPGGSSVAERIRATILEEQMDPWCELFLYEAARAEHLAKTIRPALSRGDIVLCDRFTDSTLAYQAHARSLPWNAVKSLNRWATQGLSPHLTVLVDVDPAIGLARARDKNRFEEEGVAFQAKVRKGFLKSRREQPNRWLVLKAAAATPEQKADRVLKEIVRRFGRRL